MNMTPLYYITDDNIPTAWTGESIAGIQHPLDIGDKWPETELNRIGLYHLIDNVPTPDANSEITGSTIEIINGKPTRQYVMSEITETTVPMTISRLQAKAALHQLGYLEDIEVLVATSDFMVRLAWKEALEFQRESTLINNMKEEAGLTDTDLDEIFTLGASIEF